MRPWTNSSSFWEIHTATFHRCQSLISSLSPIRIPNIWQSYRWARPHDFSSRIHQLTSPQWFRVSHCVSSAVCLTLSSHLTPGYPWCSVHKLASSLHKVRGRACCSSVAFSLFRAPTGFWRMLPSNHRGRSTLGNLRSQSAWSEICLWGEEP